MPKLNPETIESNLHNLGLNDSKLNLLLSHVDQLENQLIKFIKSIEDTNEELKILAQDTSKIDFSDQNFHNTPNNIRSKIYDLQLLTARVQDQQNLAYEGRKLLLMHDALAIIKEILKNNHEVFLNLAKAKDY